MREGQTPCWLRRTVSARLLDGLLWVGVVMWSFVAAIAWAATNDLRVVVTAGSGKNLGHHAASRVVVKSR